jgi:hypothetical protein
MAPLIYKFSYEKKLYRDVVYNQFLQDYPDLFYTKDHPQRLEREFTDNGFVSKVEYALFPDLFWISIACRTVEQVNAVMDVFYAVPPGWPFQTLPVEEFV